MPLARLLLLIAMLFMPLGMTSPAAMAKTHSVASNSEMQHCPEPGSKPDAKHGFADCTMACSAALPAVDCFQDEPLTTAREPTHLGVAQRLTDLHPETATPPPKRA